MALARNVHPYVLFGMLYEKSSFRYFLSRFVNAKGDTKGSFEVLRGESGARGVQVSNTNTPVLVSNINQSYCCDRYHFDTAAISYNHGAKFDGGKKHENLILLVHICGKKINVKTRATRQGAPLTLPVFVFKRST